MCIAHKRGPESLLWVCGSPAMIVMPPAGHSEPVALSIPPRRPPERSLRTGGRGFAKQSVKICHAKCRQPTVRRLGTLLCSFHLLQRESRTEGMTWNIGLRDLPSTIVVGSAAGCLRRLLGIPVVMQLGHRTRQPPLLRRSRAVAAGFTAAGDAAPAVFSEGSRFGSSGSGHLLLSLSQVSEL